jgi:YidC/Oxa1 family membrane protein insertase
VDKRFTLFAILVAAFFVANQIIYSFLFPPKPAPERPKGVQVAKAEPGKKAEPGRKGEDKAADKAADQATGKPAESAAEPKESPQIQAAPERPEAEAGAEAAAEKSASPPRWIALGSADPADPYRMLVTFNSRGAAVERLELNSPRYRDLEDFSGYLGHLAPADAPDRGGAIARVVGAGTPAARAGLQVNDVITAIGDHKVASAAGLVEALKQTEANTEVAVSILRDGAAQKLSARLGRRPLEVMRPEFESQAVEIVRDGNHDPLSFLMALQQFDDQVLEGDAEELKGSKLRTSDWEVASSDQEQVTFHKTLPQFGLRVLKKYRLEKVPAAEMLDADFPAYHLWLDVELENVGRQAHRVAYRLEGPTGLPIEGAWYANKVSQGSMFSAAGLRDVITRFEGGATTQITPSELVNPNFKAAWPDSPLDYIAVDAQYFSAALIPQKPKPTDILFANVKATRVGAIPEDKANLKLLDVSFRLESTVAELAPGEKSAVNRFQIFAGPKRPGLLAHYEAPGTTVNLGELVYYGWFGFVARPMLAMLHAFYQVVANYGIAIIMLTVLVRGCMFPLSRKQALGAQKMQMLQPEIKRINEKYKSEPEKKTRATQELFRQHNYNPVGGCLLMFVQLPIFVGLYRSLMVDVELRQAPLFSESIRWASNLAAPDMLRNWSGIMPDFISHGTGFFGLGPYLNVFPIITVALFIWQQRMFMPPPADEQAALQQKMMQYMTIFMCIMFYKVASGLCLYFIASSIWGIAERKLLPKSGAKADDASGRASPVLSSTTTNGAPAAKKRQRGRK